MSFCNTTTAITTRFLPFANSIPNPDGGTHLTGFRTALTKAVNQYAKTNSLVKEKDPAISGDDVREGLDLRPQHQTAEPALRIANQGEAR